MQIKTFSLSLVFIVTLLNAIVAQELTIKSLTPAPMDLSASQNERKDLAGQTCGLVKVQLAATGAQFEGNVIGQTEYKTGEYWVYISEGTYMLTVKHPNFVPLDINFKDYGISGVSAKATYKLILLLPESREESMQQFTIRYSPKDAIVIIDSKPYQGYNGEVTVSLPVGQHNYLVTASGYDPIEGSIRLKASASSTLRIDLEKTKVNNENSPMGKSQLSENVEELPTTTSVSSSMTASEMNILGDDYYYGRNGKKKDYGEAVKWYRKAAEQGDADGQYNLALMYRNGYGVPNDDVEAVKWYRLSAEQNNVLAQANLGGMYDRGIGVPHDYTEAFKWYKKSAEKGFAPSQALLGYMYELGNGVTKDSNEAAKWYRKAAEQGNASGQYNLGTMYENGYGVSKDLSQAIYWFQKAADQGYSTAKEKLIKLERQNNIEPTD